MSDFQSASPILSVLLSIVLQSFLKPGFLSDGYLIAMIVLILKNKKGDMTFKNNYRPIAIVTVMSKILEICVQIKLEDYLWKTDSQFATKQGILLICVFLFQGEWFVIVVNI